MEIKQKKKLLVTASTFPRWEGDTEPRFVLDLASHMTDEYDVTALVPAAPGAKDTEILDGVKVIRYHYFPIHKWETLCYPGAIVPRIKEKKIRVLLVPFLFLSLYFHLLRLLPQFDLVHAHWLIPQGIVQSFFKKPYIVTGHGGDVTSLNKGIMKKLKVRCLKRASKVTVVSEYLKSVVEELAEHSIEEPMVCSMGVDISKFGRQYRKENFFGQSDKKVILFVGRLVEIKGVYYLIEAMKSVDAVLIIAGDGPLHDELVEHAKEQGDKIRFIGSKTHDELKEIYASADIFVVPSITSKNGAREGLGLVMFEAMASGLPIVACKTGGIIEVIEDRKTGLLCEEKNANELSKKINILLEDEELVNFLIANSNTVLDKYNYNTIASNYKKLIENIM